MSVLIDKDTKVICQGITGSFGAQHTKGCLLYGTRMVGGVTPGKGGKKDDNGLPIFDTVRQSVEATGADATMIFVPPAFTADAIYEAMDAGIRVIVAVTEGVPVNDMVRVRAEIDHANETRSIGDRVALIGPNCPGVITPGPKTGGGESKDDPYTIAGCKICIMPGYIHSHVSEAPSG
jgi:succinyl-CoA synthetase alpha subunit